jgi:hypothetical protein
MSSVDRSRCWFYKRPRKYPPFLVLWMRRKNITMSIQEKCLRHVQRPTRCTLFTGGIPAGLPPKSPHSRNRRKFLDFICIPELLFLHSIFQNSKQPEITWARARRILSVIKGYRLIAPHFADDFISVVAVRVAYVRGRLFSPALILRSLPQIR